MTYQSRPYFAPDGRCELYFVSVNLLTFSAQDFDHIVRFHCRDRAGVDFIERGDYHVIRSGDSQMISRSEFANMVESGMKLEMSIVLRQKTANQERCPRCSHLNSHVAASRSWIEWQVSPNIMHAGCEHNYCSYKCVGRFRVERGNLKNRSDKGHGGKIHGDQSGKSGAKTDSTEIVLHAAYVTALLPLCNQLIGDTIKERSQEATAA